MSDAHTRPFWVSAFLDLAPDRWDAGLAFWAAATGSTLSPFRGEHDEFTTLLPGDGDDYLRAQRLADAATAPDGVRVHLDLHVVDPHGAADRAQRLGAHVVHRSGHGYVVLTSPGGLTFCFVTHPAQRRPAARRWTTYGDGHASLLDQVAIDVPAEHAATEALFWEELTGWPRRASASSREFTPLQRPAGQPLRFLVHHLMEQTGPVRAHLDYATDDRSAETHRHEQLGASVVRRFDHWTVLRCPAGSTYCLTDRDPVTGLLG
ncbi:MAG: hypothetical protein CMH83_09725 [Nocardioides sp.]|nr:hypothetical protein [Nocardioides sp.]